MSTPYKVKHHVFYFSTGLCLNCHDTAQANFRTVILNLSRPVTTLTVTLKERDSLRNKNVSISTLVAPKEILCGPPEELRITVKNPALEYVTTDPVRDVTKRRVHPILETFFSSNCVKYNSSPLVRFLHIQAQSVAHPGEGLGVKTPSF